MSCAGVRWAKVPGLCAAWGINPRKARSLGGWRYLESLPELSRQVLINSLGWTVGKPKRPNARKSPKVIHPRTKAKTLPVSVERMMQLAARRAA